MNETLSLQQLVDKAVVRHSTSVRQLGFLAKDNGYSVVGTTLSHIRAGRYKSVPSDDTIRAIAWLAGVTEEVAFTAAGQPVPGPPLADELPPGADNLSAKSRKAVLEMVRVLVDLEAGNHEDQDKPETNPPSKRTLRAVGPRGAAGQGQKTSHSMSDTDLDAIAAALVDLLASNAGTDTSRISRKHAESALVDADTQEVLGIDQELSSDAIFMKRLKICTLEKVKQRRDELGLPVERRRPPIDVIAAGGVDQASGMSPDDPAFLIPPPMEQLAAHPNFKTQNEKFEEQYGERGEEDQRND